MPKPSPSPINTGHTAPEARSFGNGDSAAKLGNGLALSAAIAVCGVIANHTEKMRPLASEPAARAYAHTREVPSTCSGHSDVTAPPINTKSPNQIQETNGFTWNLKVARLLCGSTVPTMV